MTRRLNRTGLSLLLAIVAVALLAPTLSQTEARAQERGLDDSVQQWSSRVWQSALEGDSGALKRFFASIPADAQGNAKRFRETYSLHLENTTKATETREAARAEAEAELREHVESGNLSESLLAAVKIQTLSENLDDVFADAVVKQVIARAERELPEVEASLDWLYAQEILFRLRTLYEDTSETELYERYKERLDAINRRVSLLARYVPERLHELRSLAAQRAGEEPLGEFNPALVEDWRERQEGVDERMLRFALNTAAREHIEQAGWKPLITGGLEALLLLATTPALGETFPAIVDQSRVQSWANFVRGEITRLDRMPGGALTLGSLRDTLDDLRALNARTLELPANVLYREFGDGAMYRLDQFSEVIWPDRLRRFRQATQGNFVGVGILIRHNEKKEIMVVNPLEGTPAYFAGVKPDDLIVEVDGESTVGWSLNDAVDRITGRQGTKVTIGLKRADVDDVIYYDIRRDVIKLRTVYGWWKDDIKPNGDPVWDWYVDPVNRIAYVRLSQFTEDTYEDLLNAWDEIKKAGQPNGLILDLRYNPGGLLTAAVSVSNLLVQRGVIVSGEDKNGQPAWPDLKARSTRAEMAGTPTVVLINKGSASASEIVSGCLQAYDKAVVVGERSYGKGSVQTVHSIAADAVLKLTTQYYRLPHPEGPAFKGRLVHKRPGETDWGVEPDIIVKMTPKQAEDSYWLRQKADLIPENEAGEPDPDAEDRPDISRLLREGLDPQLETALLILQARALGLPGDVRHAAVN